MGFCRNCGTEMAEEEMFCKNCGTAVEQPQGETTQENNVEQGNAQEAEATPAETVATDAPVNTEGAASDQMPQYGQAAQSQPANQMAPTEKKGFFSNPKNVKLTILLAALLLVIIIIVVVVVLVLNYNKKKINLEEMVEVEYTGLDGEGEAIAYIDEGEFVYAYLNAVGNEKLAKKMKKAYKDEDLAEIEKLYDKYDDVLRPCEMVYENIDLDISEDSGLSNGDVVTVTISYSKSFAKDNGVVLKGKSVEDKVKDLKEAQELDPFDGLEVDFSGTSPYGKASVSYYGSASFLYSSSFEIDKSEDLSNGDVIVVTCTLDPDVAKDYGYVLTETECEYEVSGLSELVTSYDDLESEDQNTLREIADEQVSNYRLKNAIDQTTGNPRGDYTVTEPTYCGTIARVEKNYSSYYTDLLFVYSMDVTSTTGSFQPTKLYVVVEISEVELDEDGEVEYYTAGISTRYDSTYANMNGYTDIQKLFEGMVKNYSGMKEYDLTSELEALIEE